ncbi:MAG: hypothetical protein JWQ16_804 [Novosphingobium sp.]|nr:hypothetical protein [Novosphingobium sp.]
MGEYEPEDSRNITGTASTQDGRWTGQADNDPTRQDQQQAQQGGQASQQGFAEPFTQQEAAQSGQQQQSSGEIGQENDGVSNASNQGNDHTSGIGQPQQFDASSGQQGGGGQGGGQQGGGQQFAGQLAKHQEVVDSNGQHVGTIDHVDGDRIKLTRKDSPDGEHHYISLSDVAGVEGDQVRLSGAAGSGTQA